jgi:hypothetical protein
MIFPMGTNCRQPPKTPKSRLATEAKRLLTTASRLSDFFQRIKLGVRIDLNTAFESVADMCA